MCELLDMYVQVGYPVGVLLHKPTLGCAIKGDRQARMA